MKNAPINNIFIAGGGTGGHLFPALAIGNELKKYGHNIIYIGSKHGFEKRYFKKINIKAELLNIKGIQRDLSIQSLLKNLFFPIRFISSYFKSIYLIIKFRPKIIIGTGGYSSGMPLLAGIHMKVPTLIQDQNSIPGLITRKLNKKVTVLCLAYKNAMSYFNHDKIFLTGNPIRNDLICINKNEAKSKLNLDCNKKMIFILGGSQGSLSINNHIVNNAEYYNKNFNIFLQCGENNYNNINKKLKKFKNIIIKQFIDDISTIYSASDLVISRAGALAISELCFMKKAFILIPYLYAADNHQELNAKEIEMQKGCLIVREYELKTGKLEKLVNILFSNNEKLKGLEVNSEKIAFKNATKVISDKIINTINN